MQFLRKPADDKTTNVTKSTTVMDYEYFVLICLEVGFFQIL